MTYRNLYGEPITKQQYVEDKIDILKDFLIIVTKKDETAVREILNRKTTEIQMDNVVRTLVSRRADIETVRREYAAN